MVLDGGLNWLIHLNLLLLEKRVTFPGFNGEPGSDDVLNPKKKVWETLQVDPNTNTELVASYKDIPITTFAGVCTVSSVARGSIR
ncbi:methionine--trna ligase [Quercus suber]|uniref:Methionine--trna ligase n=1 Tax=Quercus suber TaxID=58331 RepID=A0AAW0IXF9_QUESU